MRKRFVVSALFISCMAFCAVAFAEAQGSGQGAAQELTPIAAWKYISAALAVGFACIGGGLAVGKLGAAAMGAIAEDPSLSGKALPYLGLAEGICLWGFLVALLILML
jgi:V/A-type H+/Na+-transporting ATPase subunit K